MNQNEKLDREVKNLGEEINYTIQYVDSARFLYLGIVFGVFGSIWGSIIFNFLISRFGYSYGIGTLTILSVLLIYWLSFTIRRVNALRKNMKKDINGVLDAISKEVKKLESIKLE